MNTKLYILFILYICVYISVARECSTQCGQNDACCAANSGDVCYNPQTHACVKYQGVSVLCGKSDLACGSICYSPSTHRCCNGGLVSNQDSNPQSCGVKIPSSCEGESADSFIESLLQKLTLKQKIGQMSQIDITLFMKKDEIDYDLLRKTLVEYQVGSLFNSPFVSEGGAKWGLNVTQWRELISLFHQISLGVNDAEDVDPNLYLSGENISIPIIFGLDSVHGAGYLKDATYFPHEIGVAATFNEELAERVAQIAAKESRLAGVMWTFAPDCDVTQHMRWPRLYETFGEDPYVVSRMCAASVRGFHGDGCERTIVATAKHYLGYGFQISGNDRTQSWISINGMLDYHLPPFIAAINAGVDSIMLNSGEVNGEPLHGSKKWVQHLLKDKLNYDGVIVTDWQDVLKLFYMHHVSPDYNSATQLSVEAGIDMSMVPVEFGFPDLLYKQVVDGVVSEKRIDESVRRILKMKHAVGLFDEPLPQASSSDLASVGSSANRQVALEVARESITLLKNDGILPLSKSITKVLVTGPAADSLRVLNGGWTMHWQGSLSDSEFAFGYSILDGFLSVLSSSSVQVVHWNGSTFDNNGNLEDVKAMSVGADVIVVAIGEGPYTEMVGNIQDALISDAQIRLVQALQTTGVPIVGVLVEGRPRVIGPIVNHFNALLQAYLPGSEGGLAIAEILFGDVNPSGKLPYTYPNSTGLAPVTYYHKYADEQNGAWAPLYAFGHGLSYTTFAYSNLVISHNVTNKYEKFEISVTVTNTGSRAGKETVLLYISDVYRSVTPEVKMLKRYEKVNLAAGASKRVSFSLTPSDLSFAVSDLSHSHQAMDVMGHVIAAEKGEFIANIGTLSQSFYLAETFFYDLNDFLW